MSCVIHHILISPGHNFFGPATDSPGKHPAIEKEEATLVAGKGIEGDRYSLGEKGHRKQITFFDMATIETLSQAFNRTINPELVRRNIFVRGIELPKLVGKRFLIDGIEFLGIDPCPPCQWMDKSVGEGARALMDGRAGLRAQILTDGKLRLGPVEFVLIGEES